MFTRKKKSYDEEDYELDNMYNDDERYRVGEPSVWYN